MSKINICRHPLVLRPENNRVIIRPFIPESGQLIATVIGRALGLSEQEAAEELSRVCAEFSFRHHSLEALLLDNYAKVQGHMFTQRPISRTRELLIGALFSGEYTLESSALFNPSMVPHPDQGNLPEGAVRFVMSLRATGEGHISSLEFRSGVITGDGNIHLDEVSPYVSQPGVIPNPSYLKRIFVIKLHEMGFDNTCTGTVMEPLADRFTRSDLQRSVEQFRRDHVPISESFRHTLACIQWLADSNYELEFSADLAMSERAIFPVSTNESNGIEDARFVRFSEEDGTTTYYATYTAYSGHSILPQLLETSDFLHFRAVTLNGSAVQNKGMALFPRRIHGAYAMLSRQDDENLFIMFSDNPHYWSEPRILLRPAETWESVKIGNCGSPIETAAGWLVITHGVGPMRKYCIGACLLDLDDPTKVLGRLQEPLIVPEAEGRNGYVPNVVYSCGSMLHGNTLLLPYAMSDQATSVVSIERNRLLAALKA